MSRPLNRAIAGSAHAEKRGAACAAIASQKSVISAVVAVEATWPIQGCSQELRARARTRWRADAARPSDRAVDVVPASTAPAGSRNPERRASSMLLQDQGAHARWRDRRRSRAPRAHDVRKRGSFCR